MKMLVKLIFAEAETGIVLTSDGSRASNENEPYYPTFETKEEATAAMEHYLQKYPFSECSIEEEGKETKIIQSEGFDNYFEQKKLWLKWKHSSKWKRFFTKEPDFEYSGRENKTTEPGIAHNVGKRSPLS